MASTCCLLLCVLDVLSHMQEVSSWEAWSRVLRHAELPIDSSPEGNRMGTLACASIDDARASCCQHVRSHSSEETSRSLTDLVGVSLAQVFLVPGLQATSQSLVGACETYRGAGAP